MRAVCSLAPLAFAALALVALPCLVMAEDKAPPPAAVAGPMEVGENMVGEACRLQPVPPRDAKDKAKTYDLMCGTWESASGRVVISPLYDALPAEEAAYKDRLARDQAQTGWALDLSQRVNCQPGEWTGGPGGRPALLSSCMLRAGSWPHMAVATGRGNQIYQADGIPAASEVLLKAIEMLQEGRPPAPASQAELIRRLQAQLGANAMTFGRGELGNFEQLTQLARLGNSIEDYSGAENAYRRALAIQERVLGGDSVGVGETLMALALETSNQGRYEESAALFRRAEPLLQRSFDKAARARLLSYQAYDAGNAGDLRTSLILARESSAVRRALVNDLDGGGGVSSASAMGSLVVARGELVHSLMLEATMALRQHQVGVAEAAILEARSLYDRTRGLPGWWQARIRSIQGQVQAAKGNFDQAAVLLKQAAQTQLLLFGEGWPVASQLLDLGQMQSDADRDGDAVSTFRDAFKLLAKETSPPSQLGFDRIAPFLKSAAVLGDAEPSQRPALAAEMFETIQLARDGVVGQTIARTSVRLQTDNTKVAELIRQQQDASRLRDRLRLDLSDASAKPDKERDKAKEDDLTRQLADSMVHSQALDQQLQAAFPGYAKLTRFKAVAAGEVSQALADDEALLAFTFGKVSSFGFLIRKDGISAFEVPATAADIAGRVGELRRAFSPVAGKLPRFDVEGAHALYKILFAGAEARLAGVRHLVMVPNGALLALPPALLVTEPPAEGAELRATAWLVHKMAVAVVPSVQAFMSMRGMAGRTPAPKPFAGFANPPFVGLEKMARDRKPSDGGLAALGQECRTGAPLNPDLLRALSPLPETADEVRKVASVLGAGSEGIVTGAGVTKAAVRDGALDQYRILYFATHGLLPGELRCQSEPGLALAPPDAMPASAADDGLLTASDIASLKLNADLVVLSACNTAGGGGRFGGEALSGLAESFFFAGSRALLVSHWQVPSAATVRLMTELFQGMAGAASLTGPEALAQSQLRLAADAATAHPYFWAAFTLVGDGAPAGAAATKSAAAAASQGAL